VTWKIGTLALIGLPLTIVVYSGAVAQRKLDGRWNILLCTEDKTRDDQPEPFTLRFNERKGKAQLGNEFDAEINDARIDFFIPFGPAGTDEGSYYSVNRITGRYAVSHRSKTIKNER
jgi:hypothetical protein